MILLIALAFSLGVHLLVFLSIGLTGIGTPQVRAYRWFVGAVAAWLVLALLAGLDVGSAFTRPAAGTVAHFLPIVLLAGGALHAAPAVRAFRPAIIAVAAMLLPFTLTASPWHHGVVELAYYAGAWSLVGAGVFAAMRSTAPAIARRRWSVVTAVLVAGLVLIGALVSIGAIAAIALLAALLQSVVLYATVRLSLYAVREDASRTGALAADAAEYSRRALAGEIAAMVAHEVRNPLTGVRSLAQRLSDDHASPERRRRYAELIVREVDRVERIVSALLGASARHGSRGAGESDVTRLFEDVTLLVSDRYRRTGVELTVEPVSTVLAAPPEPLAQVLLNLLLNAVQQAPRVRHVRLCAIHANGDSTRTVTLLVQDDGPGVPAAERERVFQPFHSGTGGSGLGLAVVRRLCDEWGWAIAVRESPGGGATFALSVPQSVPHLRQPAEALETAGRRQR